MKKTTTSNKAILLLTTGCLLLSLSFLVVSCNDEKEHEHAEVKPPKINCVILSRAQLQAWVDSGWTKPGSQGQISEIVLQFAGANGGTSFQLLGYPGNGPASVRNAGKITLGVDTACKAKPFTGEIVLGNNILRFGKLGVFNKEGGLNKFDFIKLTPEQKYPPYVNFKVEVMNREQGSGEDDETRPCPEWCSPPGGN